MHYIFCVCPAWASGIEDTKIFQRVKVPYVRELKSRSISKSHFVRMNKVVVICEDSSEGSETANPGSNEQELDTEAV